MVYGDVIWTKNTRVAAAPNDPRNIFSRDKVYKTINRSLFEELPLENSRRVRLGAGYLGAGHLGAGHLGA